MKQVRHVRSYLTAYAGFHNLTDTVRCNCRVTHVEPLLAVGISPVPTAPPVLELPPDAPRRALSDLDSSAAAGAADDVAAAAIDAAVDASTANAAASAGAGAAVAAAGDLGDPTGNVESDVAGGAHRPAPQRKRTLDGIDGGGLAAAAARGGGQVGAGGSNNMALQQQRWLVTCEDGSRGARGRSGRMQTMLADFVVLATGSAGGQADTAAAAAVNSLLAQAGAGLAGGGGAFTAAMQQRTRLLHVREVGAAAWLQSDACCVTVLGEGPAATDTASAVALLRRGGGGGVRLVTTALRGTLPPQAAVVDQTSQRSSGSVHGLHCINGDQLLLSARRRALAASLQPHYTAPQPGPLAKVLRAPAKRRFWALVKDKLALSGGGGGGGSGSGSASSSSGGEHLVLWAPSLHDPRFMHFLSAPLRQALLGGAGGDGDLTLYRGMVHPDVPGLAFVGLEAHAGSGLLLLELQAQWLAAHLAGQLALPSAAAMRADVAAQRAWRSGALAHPLMSAGGSLARRHEQWAMKQLLSDLQGVVAVERRAVLSADSVFAESVLAVDNDVEMLGVATGGGEGPAKRRGLHSLRPDESASGGVGGGAAAHDAEAGAPQAANPETAAAAPSDAAASPAADWYAAAADGAPGTAGHRSPAALRRVSHLILEDELGEGGDSYGRLLPPRPTHDVCPSSPQQCGGSSSHTSGSARRLPTRRATNDSAILQQHSVRRAPPRRSTIGSLAMQQQHQQRQAPGSSGGGGGALLLLPGGASANYRVVLSVTSPYMAPYLHERLRRASYAASAAGGGGGRGDTATGSATGTTESELLPADAASAAAAAAATAAAATGSASTARSAEHVQHYESVFTTAAAADAAAAMARLRAPGGGGGGQQLGSITEAGPPPFPAHLVGEQLSSATTTAPSPPRRRALHGMYGDSLSGGLAPGGGGGCGGCGGATAVAAGGAAAASMYNTRQFSEPNPGAGGGGSGGVPRAAPYAAAVPAHASAFAAPGYAAATQQGLAAAGGGADAARGLTAAGVGPAGTVFGATPSQLLSGPAFALSGRAVNVSNGGHHNFIMRRYSSSLGSSMGIQHHMAQAAQANAAIVAATARPASGLATQPGCRAGTCTGAMSGGPTAAAAAAAGAGAMLTSPTTSHGGRGAPRPRRGSSSGGPLGPGLVAGLSGFLSRLSSRHSVSTANNASANPAPHSPVPAAAGAELTPPQLLQLQPQPQQVAPQAPSAAGLKRGLGSFGAAGAGAPAGAPTGGAAGGGGCEQVSSQLRRMSQTTGVDLSILVDLITDEGGSGALPIGILTAMSVAHGGDALGASSSLGAGSTSHTASGWARGLGAGRSGAQALPGSGGGGGGGAAAAYAGPGLHRLSSAAVQHCFGSAAAGAAAVPPPVTTAADAQTPSGGIIIGVAADCGDGSHNSCRSSAGSVEARAAAAAAAAAAICDPYGAAMAPPPHGAAQRHHLDHLGNLTEGVIQRGFFQYKGFGAASVSSSEYGDDEEDGLPTGFCRHRHGHGPSERDGELSCARHQTFDTSILREEPLQLTTTGASASGTSPRRPAASLVDLGLLLQPAASAPLPAVVAVTNPAFEPQAGPPAAAAADDDDQVIREVAMERVALVDAGVDAEVDLICSGAAAVPPAGPTPARMGSAGAAATAPAVSVAVNGSGEAWNDDTGVASDAVASAARNAITTVAAPYVDIPSTGGEEVAAGIITGHAGPPLAVRQAPPQPQLQEAMAAAAPCSPPAPRPASPPASLSPPPAPKVSDAAKAKSGLHMLPLLPVGLLRLSRPQEQGREDGAEEQRQATPAPAAAHSPAPEPPVTAPPAAAAAPGPSDRLARVASKPAAALAALFSRRSEQLQPSSPRPPQPGVAFPGLFARRSEHPQQVSIAAASPPPLQAPSGAPPDESGSDTALDVMRSQLAALKAHLGNPQLVPFPALASPPPTSARSMTASPLASPASGRGPFRAVAGLGGGGAAGAGSAALPRSSRPFGVSADTSGTGLAVLPEGEALGPPPRTSAPGSMLVHSSNSHTQHSHTAVPVFGSTVSAAAISSGAAGAAASSSGSVAPGIGRRAPPRRSATESQIGKGLGTGRGSVRPPAAAAAAKQPISPLKRTNGGGGDDARPPTAAALPAPAFAAYDGGAVPNAPDGASAPALPGDTTPAARSPGRFDRLSRNRSATSVGGAGGPPAGLFMRRSATAGGARNVTGAGLFSDGAASAASSPRLHSAASLTSAAAARVAIAQAMAATQNLTNSRRIYSPVTVTPAASSGPGSAQQVGFNRRSCSSAGLQAGAGVGAGGAGGPDSYSIVGSAPGTPLSAGHPAGRAGPAAGSHAGSTVDSAPGARASSADPALVMVPLGAPASPAVAQSPRAVKASSVKKESTGVVATAAAALLSALSPQRGTPPVAQQQRSPLGRKARRLLPFSWWPGGSGAVAQSHKQQQQGSSKDRSVGSSGSRQSGASDLCGSRGTSFDIGSGRELAPVAIAPVPCAAAALAAASLATEDAERSSAGSNVASSGGPLARRGQAIASAGSSRIIRRRISLANLLGGGTGSSNSTCRNAPTASYGAKGAAHGDGSGVLGLLDEAAAAAALPYRERLGTCSVGYGRGSARSGAASAQTGPAGGTHSGSVLGNSSGSMALGADGGTNPAARLVGMVGPAVADLPGPPPPSAARTWFDGAAAESVAATRSGEVIGHGGSSTAAMVHTGSVLMPAGDPVHTAGAAAAAGRRQPAPGDAYGAAGAAGAAVAATARRPAPAPPAVTQQRGGAHASTADIVAALPLLPFEPAAAPPSPVAWGEVPAAAAGAQAAACRTPSALIPSSPFSTLGVVAGSLSTAPKAAAAAAAALQSPQQHSPPQATFEAAAYAHRVGAAAAAGAVVAVEPVELRAAVGAAAAAGSRAAAGDAADEAAGEVITVSTQYIALASVVSTPLDRIPSAVEAEPDATHPVAAVAARAAASATPVTAGVPGTSNIMHMHLSAAAPGAAAPVVAAAVAAAAATPLPAPIVAAVPASLASPASLARPGGPAQPPAADDDPHASYFDLDLMLTLRRSTIYRSTSNALPSHVGGGGGGGGLSAARGSACGPAHSQSSVSGAPSPGGAAAAAAAALGSVVRFSIDAPPYPSGGGARRYTADGRDSGSPAEDAEGATPSGGSRAATAKRRSSVASIEGDEDSGLLKLLERFSSEQRHSRQQQQQQQRSHSVKSGSEPPPDFARAATGVSSGGGTGSSANAGSGSLPLLGAPSVPSRLRPPWSPPAVVGISPQAAAGRGAITGAGAAGTATAAAEGNGSGLTFATAAPEAPGPHDRASAPARGTAAAAAAAAEEAEEAEAAEAAEAASFRRASQGDDAASDAEPCYFGLSPNTSFITFHTAAATPAAASSLWSQTTRGSQSPLTKQLQQPLHSHALSLPLRPLPEHMEVHDHQDADRPAAAAAAAAVSPASAVAATTPAVTTAAAHHAPQYHSRHVAAASEPLPPPLQAHQLDLRVWPGAARMEEQLAAGIIIIGDPPASPPAACQAADAAAATAGYPERGRGGGGYGGHVGVRALPPAAGGGSSSRLSWTAGENALSRGAQRQAGGAGGGPFTRRQQPLVSLHRHFPPAPPAAGAMRTMSAAAVAAALHGAPELQKQINTASLRNVNSPASPPGAASSSGTVEVAQEEERSSPGGGVFGRQHRNGSGPIRKAMSSGLEAPVFSNMLGGLFGGSFGSGTGRTSRRSLFNLGGGLQQQSSPFRVAASTSTGVAGAASSPRLSMGHRCPSGNTFTLQGGARHAQQISALAAAMPLPGGAYGAAATAATVAAAAAAAVGNAGGSHGGGGYRPRLSSPNFTALDDELLAAARWSAARLEAQQQQQHGHPHGHHHHHYLHQGRLSPALGSALPLHPSPLSAGASATATSQPGGGLSPMHSHAFAAAHHQQHQHPHHHHQHHHQNSNTANASPASPLLQHIGGSNYYSRITSARRSGACSSASLTPASSVGPGGLASASAAAASVSPFGARHGHGDDEHGELLAPERSVGVISAGVLVMRGSSCGPATAAADASGGGSVGSQQQQQAVAAAPGGGEGVGPAEGGAGGSGWQQQQNAGPAAADSDSVVSEVYELGGGSSRGEAAMALNSGTAAGVAGTSTPLMMAGAGSAAAAAAAAAVAVGGGRDPESSCSTRVDSGCSTVGAGSERRGGPAWEVRQASQARQEQLVSEVGVILAEGGAGPQAGCWRWGGPRQQQWRRHQQPQGGQQQHQYE
ncbi:hypothetical protein HYH02_001252 [Chlamydomonas schloesseri]|uniref:Uncharacterized protein n=1 Tax=Chlamydomonas schloesseri TaxID=2026947 RepID=A0A835WW14_9CHLO|nr:hypothetical protein HYH02_001252 [Chlamydomonas schloesseri]|eukprot:KAG2454218.1 hypothetical protein HYH02_001252 [Chlamydomonas schloesseri]